MKRSFKDYIAKEGMFDNIDTFIGEFLIKNKLIDSKITKILSDEIMSLKRNISSLNLDKDIIAIDILAEKINNRESAKKNYNTLKNIINNLSKYDDKLDEINNKLYKINQLKTRLETTLRDIEAEIRNN